MTREQLQSYLQFLSSLKVFPPERVENATAHYFGDRVRKLSPAEGAQLVTENLCARKMVSAGEGDIPGLVAQWMHSEQRTIARTQAVAPPSDRLPRPAATPPADALPKQIGPYRIIKKLGQGGMGAVYLGQHKDLGLKVAVKTIAGALIDPEAVERFRREAIVVIGLNHPNLIRGYDVAVDKEPRFIALEFIEGQDLGDVVQEGKTPDTLTLMTLWCDACRGTQAMHARMLVHRDLKPANIRVDNGGRVVVMDPGMVKSLSGKDVQNAAASVPDQPVEEGLTMQGTLLGTPMYMAPEQIINPDEIGPATDVYALGKIGFFLFTRTFLHYEATLHKLMQAIAQPELPEVFAQQLQLAFSDKEELRRAQAILEKALAFKTGDRYKNAGALAEAIDGFITWSKNRAVDRARRLIKVLAGVLSVLGLTVLVSLIRVASLSQARKAEEQAKHEAEARAREAQGRVEAEAKAAQAAQAARDAEARKAEVSRKLVIAQAFMNGADWPQAIRELREILSIDEDAYAARWLLAEALYNTFDADYLAQYQWLADHLTNPDDKARAQFWVVYAGIDRGGLDDKLAPGIINSMAPGMYRDLAELYYAGFQAANYMKSSYDANQAGNAQQSEDYLRQSQEWTAKLQTQLGRIKGGHWMADYLRGFITMNTGDRTKAIDLFTSCISRNPAFPMAYYYRASLIQEDNQYPQPMAAVYDAERLHALMPGWVRGELIRVGCYVAEANFYARERKLATQPLMQESLLTESLVWYDKAIALAKDYASWKEVRGDVYDIDGGAIECHIAYGYFHKARALFEAGKAEEAREAKQLCGEALQRASACREKRPLSHVTENLYQTMRNGMEKLGSPPR